MYKTGHSINITKITEELLKKHKESGIELIEVSSSYIEECESADHKMVERLAKKYGIELWSFHLPFAPFEDIDISLPQLCKYSVEYCGELIKKGADIGIDKFVIHPSGEPIEEECRRDRIECAKDSLDKLAELAKKEGAVIAVEDLPRTCLGRDSGDIKELISANDVLRVCFDTNHLLSEATVDFIHNVGDKIITTHISDYDRINERHWLPGEGIINWQELLQALKDVGYNGPWLYEIGFECPWSIIRNRDLVCEDFVRNANEIFKNEPITIFSQHKENLGMWSN